MKIRNLYLLFAWILLAGVISCSKTPSVDKGSGNVPDPNPTAKDVPAGANDGVTFINGGKSAIFNLYAPNKKTVTLTGDFNGWSTDAKYNMTNSTDGSRWWIQIDNLDPNTEYAYQYYVDQSFKIGDPYCEKVLDPDNDKYIDASIYPNLKSYPTGKTTGIVSVMEANQPAYSWTTSTFTRPEPKNLVVYELLVRDFVATHSYKTVKDTLNYIARLGVNAIELMPVNEFEGNDSWGYNPNYYFAPDKYYGTKNDLKALIDACHAKGIAVIQDIVLNHSFGSSPMVQLYSSGGVPANNPWYNTVATHPFNVGYQFNHESPATRYFVKNVVKFWMQEYKIDGFRFDLAKGFTQTNSGSDVAAWGNYDASRVAIWKDYNSYIKSIDPKLYVILEDFAGNQEESELADQGMMTWNNQSFQAEQGLMSYNDAGGSWDISGLFYDRFNFKNPYALVSYFESHDEERLQFKNAAYGNASGSYSVKDLATGLKRDELGAAFMFSSPGPKMLWQFGERGYDVSIDNGGRLGDKPAHWEYMNDANRRHLFKVYSQMIKWKINNPVFTSTTFNYSLDGAVKTIQLTDPSNSIEVVGNFGVVANTATITFPATGTWTDNFTGSTINVTSLAYTMTLAPGEYHLYSKTALH
ncbi:alpha-amylase family glycosyl hydrolase [Mucilaginibacter xinganensis]|uniref:1,4-alpha-glucan branching enzyme n=1 Tax=Mucilaginibacter xinganensis TaxID=1234841 RepID=A0A223P0W4_9SPHI|nr:alpha-amylase family glycosyl hydrolase [Mucilaginibacter xinganensis]ASU35670.1 1,4-alpha-glucan branching enzyme [Mucilaginibacter xinganensis]